MKRLDKLLLNHAHGIRKWSVAFGSTIIVMNLLSGVRHGADGILFWMARTSPLIVACAAVYAATVLAEKNTAQRNSTEP